MYNAACTLCDCIVKYAPAIGMCTLDMEEMLSRDEVYKRSLYGDESAKCDKMDVDEVFIPESECYHVVYIMQGNTQGQRTQAESV